MRDLSVLLILFVAGCSEGPIPRRPDIAVIDRLEQQLAGKPCVGSLDRWERNYTYRSEPFLTNYVGGSVAGISVWQLFRWYDYTDIDFEFRQAGYREIGTGRRIHAVIPSYQGDLDHRPYDRLFGIYDIDSDRVHLVAACGRFLGFWPRD